MYVHYSFQILDPSPKSVRVCARKKLLLILNSVDYFSSIQKDMQNG